MGSFSAVAKDSVEAALNQPDLRAVAQQPRDASARMQWRSSWRRQTWSGLARLQHRMAHTRRPQRRHDHQR